MDRIKRLTKEVLQHHQSKFGEDFAENKKILNQISIVRSKGLKNELAGYITKFIKKENNMQKMKEEQAAKQASVVEEPINEDIEIEEGSEDLPEENSEKQEELQVTE